MAPNLTGIDHIHVFVSDRAAAEDWYGRVLGLVRVPAFESWAAGDGPLTLADPSGRIHLALFERPHRSCRSTVALGTSGADFIAWLGHLEAELGRRPEPVDHGLSWSLYFEDPDGNPFEVTCYEHHEVGAGLRARGA